MFLFLIFVSFFFFPRKVHMSFFYSIFNAVEKNDLEIKKTAFSFIQKISTKRARIFRFGFGKICVIFLDSYSKARFGSYFRFGFEGKIRVIFQIRIRDSDSVYENIQIRIRDSRFGFLLKILDSDSRFGFGLCKYLDSDSRFAESCESANLKIRES